MNATTRRLAAGFAMLAAPALIALGAATTASADAATTNNGPTVSHPAFPQQANFPQPGTSVHHHHQNHR